MSKFLAVRLKLTMPIKRIASHMGQEKGFVLKNMYKYTLCKIPSFHLISWCEHFMKRHSFHKILGESHETLRKLFVSTKFPDQQFR